MELSYTGQRLTQEQPRGAQKAVVFAMSALLALWSIVALVAYPNFDTGAAVNSEKIFGADMNGWHSLLGILVFAPGVVAIRRRDWMLGYCVAAGLSLIASGVLILVENRPLGILDLPDNEIDALFFHLLPGAVYAAVALKEAGRSR
jgi:uncharacterized membrane protein